MSELKTIYINKMANYIQSRLGLKTLDDFKHGHSTIFEEF